MGVQAANETTGTPFGPIPVYTEALFDAAKKQGEEVGVAQDMLKLKNSWMLPDFKAGLEKINTDPELDVVGKAKGLVELLQPMASKVAPKFIVFLAKKQRFWDLHKINKEFVRRLYANQSIAPVKIRVAQKLTEEQVEKVKEKMRKIVGVSDVKLIQEVDGSLLAGFEIEYLYEDPEATHEPSAGISLSLRNILDKMALSEGVDVTVAAL